MANRADLDGDIKVVGEDDGRSLSYSLSHHVSLTQVCFPSCVLCKQGRRDDLIVPYSTIRPSKEARLQNVREVVYSANERPDRFPRIRSLLELWGFPSYLDYLYTVFEIGFLEGLIPVIDIGFLGPQEMKRLMEVVALIKISLDSPQDIIHDALFKRESAKRQEHRRKNLEWASKLKFPSIVSVMIKGKFSVSQLKEQLQFISSLHKSYGTIHEVILKNFSQDFKANNLSQASLKEMLHAFEIAKNILPDGVTVGVPYGINHADIGAFIKAGLRDLGCINIPNLTDLSIVDHIASIASEHDLTLHQRFPLKKSFIKNELYSKKLGQVFEAYRYRIKKDSQDKQKDSRI